MTSKVDTVRQGIGQTNSFLLTTVDLLLISPLVLLVCVVMEYRSNKPTVFGRRQVKQFKHPFGVCGFEDVAISTRGGNPRLYSRGGSGQLAHVNGFLEGRRLSRLPRL